MLWKLWSSAGGRSKSNDFISDNPFLLLLIFCMVKEETLFLIMLLRVFVFNTYW